MRPSTGISRPTLGLALLGLLTFTVGLVGQGSWGIGARAAPSAVAVAVTDVTGGAGNRRPVRVQLVLTITNLGTEAVHVLPPPLGGYRADRTSGTSGTDGNGAQVVGLEPPSLVVEPDAIGQIAADVALECDSQQPLQLPDLQLEMGDGLRRPVEISGSGKILEACSRAVVEVRPLAVELGPAAGEDPETTRPTPRQRSIVLRSPTGRRIDVIAVRTGGVTLSAPAKPVTVSGADQVVVPLTAPSTCPVQWRVAGVPSALALDLVPGADTGATLRLRIGPPLTSWLLAASCPRSR